MGPRTERSGTSEVTGTVFDFSFSGTTVWVRSERKALIHLRVRPLHIIQYLWSLSSSF